MFLSLPTFAWVAIAAAITLIHVALMRWTMPTPKGKKSVSFIPPVLGVTMVMYAVAKNYSFSVTLYLYSSILLMFVIMIVPVKKWVAADILKQEQNPDIKVKVHAPSLVWITFSMIITMGVVVAVWLSNT
ncbi:hypothetical protein I3F60_20010 [Streptomyces sp. MUM 136J]|uniref:hypothetical protein n=1 Tax=Streptomyces sp. MUM 136J TaxID=2791992 RepID=UPI001F038A2C|nr:hypothetical protein [Streptomyces sp. MUM 136J]MCH0571522.1 hypothetical protein [Streptomyces sp. MUM 136J]